MAGETAIVGKLGNKAEVTGQGALLVEVTNSSGNDSPINVTETNSTDILAYTQSIANSVAIGVRIPALTRVTTSGTNSNGLVSITYANVGVADGVVLGTVLKPGESVTFDAGNSNFFQSGTLNYDATGTEFLIAEITKI